MIRGQELLQGAPSAQFAAGSRTRSASLTDGCCCSHTCDVHLLAQPGGLPMPLPGGLRSCPWTSEEARQLCLPCLPSHPCPLSLASLERPAREGCILAVEDWGASQLVAVLGSNCKGTHVKAKDPPLLGSGLASCP